MKKQLIVRFLFLLFCPLLLVTDALEARIRFETTRSIQIDLEKLDVSKENFFRYLTEVVHTNPFGLQAYGQVPFKVCNMKLNDRRLIDYQTPGGRKIRFISNPSCDQMIIQRLLHLNYDYNAEVLGSYGNRKCIRSIEAIFSPILEYYTIHHEEKSRPNCERCDEKERDRLNKISDIQAKIADSCQSEQEKVINFLNDLDETVENAFQTKPGISSK